MKYEIYELYPSARRAYHSIGLAVKTKSTPIKKVKLYNCYHVNELILCVPLMSAIASISVGLSAISFCAIYQSTKRMPLLSLTLAYHQLLVINQYSSVSLQNRNAKIDINPIFEAKIILKYEV